MNYAHFMQKGMQLVMKEALKEAEENGLNAHYFYITFKTTFPRVSIPDYLLEKYPDKMTIVLHHEFWDLQVFEYYFSVSLIFNNVLENLKIPFNSIYRFEDPHEPITLDFFVGTNSGVAYRINDETEQEDNIISLDVFRKDRDIED